jgi:uncharacterized protein YaiL (DUF2058 family)
MFISIAAIVYNMYAERQKERNQKQEKEAEFMRLIERKVLKTVKEKAEYWDNFNIGLYVEYLEATQ